MRRNIPARPLANSSNRPMHATQGNSTGATKRENSASSNSKGRVPRWDFKGRLLLAEEKLAAFRDSNTKFTTENLVLKREIQCLQNKILALTEELRVKSDYLETEINLHRQTRMLAENSQKELESVKVNIPYLEKSNMQLQDQCNQLKEKIIQTEAHRKIMHNNLMESKGNIRVFCRVRPFLPQEVNQSCTDNIKIINENTLEIVKSYPRVIRNSFSFDRVFSPSASQADIFEELSELIQSVIDGYNVCVFAYGQTGSGKTYTMEGSFDQEASGMIPLSVDLIFSKLDEISLLGWSSYVEVSCLEIYNEQIKDLLDADNICKHSEIRNASSLGGDMILTNVKVKTVESAKEVNKILEYARAARAIAATAHNDHSSRSHFIFKLRVRISKGSSLCCSDSVLSMVDLAGSETLEDISEKLRVQETKSINKSLSNLGNVILALNEKSEYVPYRNSKLTQLLQMSLGGNSKTLMLINLSPRRDSINESLNTLRFAMRVNACHIGKAQRCTSQEK